MNFRRSQWLAAGLAAVLTGSLLSPYALAAEPSEAVRAKLADAVVLYVNSSEAYVNNNKVKIDPDNPDVRAVVKDGAILVPIRFVSENLGATVRWDEQTSTVTVTSGADTVHMTVDSKQMRVNEALQELEVPAQLIEGRTMVPLRALAEALGRHVFWDDMGVIVISDQERILDNESDAGQIAEIAGLFNRVLPIAEVTASGNDGNVPENVADGMLDTRWSSQGDGEWLQLDLGASRQVGYAAISFHSGDLRHSVFDLAVSDDGQSWRNVYSGQSSGGTIEMETFDFDDTDARYIRFIGHGNSKNKWNSITEFQVYEPSGGGTPIRRIAVVPEEKPTVTFTKPGLVNADGSPVSVHTPNAVTGTTWNVMEFGADVDDNANDDTPAIHKALAEAKPGDEIYFPNGIYNLNSTLSNDKGTNIELKSGVNLRGESMNGTVLVSGLGVETPSAKIVKALGKSNVVISDMTFTSTWNGAYSDDTTTANPDKGGPQYVLYIGPAANKGSGQITVDRVVFEKFERMAVRIESSSHIVVRNSLFKNATDVAGGGAGYGVSIQGIPKKDRTGFANDTAFNVVEHNTFEGPYIRHGALIQYYAHNNVIRNNTFKATLLDAIDLHGEDEYLNEIYGNTISDVTTGAGIGVGNTGGTAPSNHDASGPSNYIHDNVITNSREGVKVHMGSPDTVIENNTITGSAVAGGKGIYLQNAPRTIVRNNTISGNTADGFWGIVLESDPGDKRTKDLAGKGEPRDIQLIGNEVTGNTNGVKIGETSTGIVIRDNVIENNAQENLLDLSGQQISPTAPAELPADPQAPTASGGGTSGGMLPVADVEADKQAADNLGSDTRMRTKRSASGSNVRIGYFKFQVDDAANIGSAVFKISAKLTPTNDDNAQLSYDVYGLTDDSWEEGTLTWANAPNHGDLGEITGEGDSAVKLGTITLSEKKDKDYTLDVTSFAKTQTDGFVTLMIADTMGQNGNVNIYTKEKENEALRPTLTVTR